MDEKIKNLIQNAIDEKMKGLGEELKKISTFDPRTVKPKFTQLFINGQFVNSVTGKTFELINPATEEKVCDIQEGGEADVNLAVKAAKAAFPKWRNFSPAGISKILNKFADLVEKNVEEIAALECLDNGKPYLMCLNVDLPLVISHFRYLAGFADKLEGKTVDINGDFVNMVFREPFGVCGAVIPWNFPLLMFAWKVAPALACGNTMVIKSAETTPLTALYAAHLFKQAGLPDGVLNVLNGYGETCGKYIALHQDVDKMSFTGSTDVGKKMMKYSGESNLKYVSLELGGKSPLIIFPDMKDKLEWAACMSACTGVFFNQGHVCCASSRVFVHEDIYDEYLKHVVECCKKRKVLDPFDPNCEQGPQNSKNMFERYMKYIEIGKKEGATLLCGGKRVGKKGYFVEPTVFTDVKDSMTIAKEEIFGPVVCILKFKDTEEVIKRANDTIYGLAAGVFTKNLDTMFRCVRELNAGTVWGNCYNVFDANLGFGGFKQSGWGKDGSAYAIKNFMKEKVVCMSIPGLKKDKFD